MDYVSLDQVAVRESLFEDQLGSNTATHQFLFIHFSAFGCFFYTFFLVILLLLKVLGSAQCPDFDVTHLQLVSSRACNVTIPVGKVRSVINITLVFNILVNPELVVLEITTTES